MSKNRLNGFDPSKLRFSGTIDTRTEAKDGATWSSVNAWFDYEPLSGGLQGLMQAQFPGVSYKFTFRLGTAISSGKRITYQGVHYEVLDVRPDPLRCIYAYAKVWA